MKDNGETEIEKDWGNNYGFGVINMMDNGGTIDGMVMESIPGPTKGYISGVLRMINFKATERCFFQAAKSMKDNGETM